MDDEYSGERERPSRHGHHQASTTELMASGKYLAGAVQSAAGGKSGSIDKAKAASAAEDFLGAAQQYGKFDESSGIGKYVSKAEDYLHKYHSKDSQHTGAGREEEDDAPVSDNRRHERREEGEDYGREEGDGYRREEGEGRRHERRDEDEDEGYGREEKEDRRHGNRHNEDEEEETGSGGGSGFGDYINMAKGFLK